MEMKWTSVKDEMPDQKVFKSVCMDCVWRDGGCDLAARKAVILLCHDYEKDEQERTE